MRCRLNDRHDTTIGWAVLCGFDTGTIAVATVQRRGNLSGIVWVGHVECERAVQVTTVLEVFGAAGSVAARTGLGNTLVAEVAVIGATGGGLVGRADVVSALRGLTRTWAGIIERWHDTLGWPAGCASNEVAGGNPTRFKPLTTFRIPARLSPDALRSIKFQKRHAINWTRADVLRKWISGLR